MRRSQSRERRRRRFVQPSGASFQQTGRRLDAPAPAANDLRRDVEIGCDIRQLQRLGAGDEAGARRVA
jgi:hypothetical protein